MAKGDSPLGELKDDIKNLLAEMSQFATRLALIEDYIKDLKSFHRLVSGAIVLAIIAAIISLLKGK